MDELVKVEGLKALAGLLAPGFVILSLRASVQAGPRPEIKDRLFSYAAISAAYYAMALPLFNWPGGLLINGSLWFALQYFILPGAIGILAAYEAQDDWLMRLASGAGLHLAHPIPAAWDYAFSRLRSGTFVLVTLDGGDRLAGLLGRNSFASSNREERDLLIERVWSIDPSGSWTEATPARSILLCGKDIRHIEMFE